MENKQDGSTAQSHNSESRQGSLHPAEGLQDQSGRVTSGQSTENQKTRNQNRNYQNSDYQNGVNKINNPSGNTAPAPAGKSSIEKLIPLILGLAALLIAASAFLLTIHSFSSGSGSSAKSSAQTYSEEKKGDKKSDDHSNEDVGKEDISDNGLVSERHADDDLAGDGSAEKDYGEEGYDGENSAAEYNNNEDEDSDVEVSSNDSVPTGDGEKIYMILSHRDEFQSSLESGAKEAAEEIGVNLITQDANMDETKQIQYVLMSAADGQKAIIVNPVNPANCQAIIDAAGDMKVIFVSRIPEDISLLNENAVYVGSDDTYSGELQGQFLTYYFKAMGKSDIKYVLLRGIEGQTSTTIRSESVLQAMADHGINATEAYAKSCFYDRYKAQEEMEKILSDPSIEFDCIICNNDDMALGAIEACNVCGKEIDFPIVGIDASTDGREAIKDGTLAMSVFQDGKGQGSGAVYAAMNLLNGEALNYGIAFEVDDSGYILWVPSELVTPDNVADYDYR